MKKNMKKRITDTAVSLFNEKGSHSITTNHIIDKLKISPGTFYYHYRNKEQIIRDIFNLITEEFSSVISGFYEIESFSDIEENLRNLFRLYYKYRFFYTEISILLDRDRELQKIYFENFISKKEILMLLFKNMEGKGFLKKGFTSSDEYRYISEVLWIISDFRTSFLKSDNREITDESVSEGYLNYLMILKPYMTETAENEFGNLISRDR